MSPLSSSHPAAPSPERLAVRTPKHGLALLLALIVLGPGCKAWPIACLPDRPPPTVQGTLPAQSAGEARLLFVGDLSVARHVAERVDDVGGGDPRWLFEHIKPTLDAADLVFANLECAVTDNLDEEATSKTYRIRADERMAIHLKESGVDVVSVANNHAMDFGHQGHLRTLAVAKAQGLGVVGSVPGQGLQGPAIFDVGGIKVGFLGYNQHGDEYRHPNWKPASSRYRRERMLDDVAWARDKVDFLVVSVHGGPELSHEPADWQVRDAHAALDAGADTWIGHHPHVMQSWETYNDKLIVYSLGDFIFDKTSPWLVHRNKPRAFAEIVVKKSQGAGGKVSASHRLIAGDQDEHYRPLPNPGSFDLESFRRKAARTNLWSSDVEALKVQRRMGDVVVPCETWKKKRQYIKAHAFRWLAPRWSCLEKAEERKRPWLTVAATTELVDGVASRGIWAHPHGEGPLELRRDDVVLGAAVDGFGAVPDWGVIMAKKGEHTDPVRLTVEVRLAGDAQPLRLVLEVPLQRDPGTGVTPFHLDTRQWQGKKATVLVSIEGGSGADEGRFFFDLEVVPASSASSEPAAQP